MFLARGSLVALAALIPLYAAAADMDNVVYGPQGSYEPVAEADAAPEDSITGFVEGRAGYGKSADFDADGTKWALRGTANTSTPENWNFQFDGSYERTEIEGLTIGSLTGSAHAYYREPNRFAAGGFVQASRLGSNLFDALAPLGADSHAVDLLAGAEGAVYFNPVTLFAQLGFGRLSYSGYKADHQVGKLGARFYVNDNARLDVEAGLHRLDAFGGSVNLYSLSGIGNYRFETVPVTAFAGYRFDRGTLEAGSTLLGSTDAHNFLAGVRFSFGSTSLKDEERNGPAWSSTPLDL